MAIWVSFCDLSLVIARHRSATVAPDGSICVTPRQIICAHVAREFEERTAASAQFQRLVELKNPLQANLNFMTQCALEGFKSNAFILEIDGRYAYDLDDPIGVRPDSVVSFLPLKPLMVS